MTRTRILIVEPSEVIVEGLQAILANQPGFHLLDAAYSTERLTERLIASHPDVVIVHTALIDKPSAFHDEAPQAAVVALVYQYVEQQRLRAYDAIIDIRQGRSAILETVTAATRRQQGDSAETPSYELSRRETDVLVLVAKGLTNKEIADSLNVSVHTVISHRKNIMHKTGIKSVAGLTVYAMLNNLIE